MCSDHICHAFFSSFFSFVYFCQISILRRKIVDMHLKTSAPALGTWCRSARNKCTAPTGFHRKEFFSNQRGADSGAHVCVHRGVRARKDRCVGEYIEDASHIMHIELTHPPPSLTSHGHSTWRTLGPIGILQGLLSTRWWRWTTVGGEQMGWWRLKRGSSMQQWLELSELR